MIITLPGGVPVRVTVFTSTVRCSLSENKLLTAVAAAAAATTTTTTTTVKIH